MRLVLYNIRYGTASRRPRTPVSGYLRRTVDHTEAIIRFLRALDADIVGLLEVDGGSYRYNRHSQAWHMAHALGHYHSYQRKYGRAFATRLTPVLNMQGNAFLVRDRIRNARFHYFNRGMKRLVIELELDGLDVFLVHLAVSFRTRHAQLAELADLVRMHDDRPRIVAGDFNPMRGRQELARFLEQTGLRDAAGGGIPTFPSWRPSRQLDYILHSPDITVNRFAAPAVELSDHLPLVCDFTVRQRSRARAGPACPTGPRAPGERP
jgi:endonuclease/exonuclease/phosphatase family metal-dependent hydrolase